MPLSRLSLKHFRNFEHLALEFHPEFNFIYGKNAQGKTNLIEAVHYLSTLKSFRAAEKTDLIAHGAEFAGLSARFEKDGLAWDIAVSLTPERRQVLVNGKKPATRAEYHALVPLILFEPRDIYLFRDAPTERRRYMNRALFLQDPGFLATSADYDKIVAQKNRLLKDRAPLSQIEVWNERLADLGARIIAARKAWFDSIREELAREYRAISGTREEFVLDYAPSQNLLSSLPQALSPESIRDALAAKLHERLHDEIERREAFVGPHRDDFTARLDGRPLGARGSQGENRSAVIALKLAQIKVFAAKFGMTPIFLLDDVASELDATRCRYLFKYLQGESAQVFLTTTENDLMHGEFEGHSRSFLIENGAVTDIG
jgi:DNA replication and repair protein RecF